MNCVFCKSPFIEEGYSKICLLCERCECDSHEDRFCTLHLVMAGFGAEFDSTSNLSPYEGSARGPSL